MISRTRRIGRSLVVKFALSGFVVLLLMIVASLVLFQREGRAAAVERAREQALIVGDGIASYLTPALLHGDPGDRSALDAVVQRHLKAGTFVRVKLWEESGRIVYSDESRLLDLHFDLDHDDLQVLRNGGTDASLSNLSDPENLYERTFGQLLQVYVRVHTTDGTPMLFEAYSRDVNINRQAGALLKRFLPAALGGLLGLWLLQLPLARSLQRKLNAMQEDSEARLVGALGVVDRDRQHIAGELETHVLVDLRRLGQRLSAAADRVEGQDTSVVKDMVVKSASEARRISRHLELSLVELYPSSLSEHGLAGALQQCAAALDSQGIATSVDVAPNLQIDETTERLLLAAAQEGLRSLSSQTQSRLATISVDTHPGTVELTVRGDGQPSIATDGDEPLVGEPSRDPRIRSDVGVDMVRDLVERANGTLVTGSDITGSFLRVTLPAPVSSR